MAYTQRVLSTASVLQDISDLLNAPVRDMNPSEQALIAVINVSLAPMANGQIKPLNLDQSKQFYSVLFTLGGNPELGNELRSKVYELAVMLYKSCLNP